MPSAAAHKPTHPHKLRATCNGARAMMQHATRRCGRTKLHMLQVAHILYPLPLTWDMDMGLRCAIPRLFSIPLAAYCLLHIPHNTDARSHAVIRNILSVVVIQLAVKKKMRRDIYI